jgi:hypothetical protein
MGKSPGTYVFELTENQMQGKQIIQLKFINEKNQIEKRLFTSNYQSEELEPEKDNPEFSMRQYRFTSLKQIEIIYREIFLKEPLDPSVVNVSSKMEKDDKAESKSHEKNSDPSFWPNNLDAKKQAQEMLEIGDQFEQACLANNLELMKKTLNHTSSHRHLSRISLAAALKIAYEANDQFYKYILGIIKNRHFIPCIISRKIAMLAVGKYDEQFLEELFTTFQSRIFIGQWSSQNAAKALAEFMPLLEKHFPQEQEEEKIAEQEKQIIALKRIKKLVQARYRIDCMEAIFLAVWEGKLKADDNCLMQMEKLLQECSKFSPSLLITYCKQVLDKVPFKVSAYNFLSIGCDESKEFPKDRIEIFMKLFLKVETLRGLPDYSLLISLGKIFEEQKDKSRAENCYKNAMELILQQHASEALSGLNRCRKEEAKPWYSGFLNP